MDDFQKYIQRYLDLIPSENWLKEMKNAGDATLQLYHNLNEEQANFRYAEGKWSLKDVLQHMIDGERIFVYRALRFSRRDATELASYDEEEYARYFPQRSLESLTEEFEATRKSSVLFFETLDAEELLQRGTANKNEISVENLGKLLVGHNIHHLNIIKERYLPILT